MIPTCKIQCWKKKFKEKNIACMNINESNMRRELRWKADRETRSCFATCLVSLYISNVNAKFFWEKLRKFPRKVEL